MNFSIDELEAKKVSKRVTCGFALSLYRIGDVVDVRDPMLGAWFAGEVVDVRRLRPQRRSVLPPGREEASEPVKRPRHSDSSLESSSHGSFARREERLSEVSWDDAFAYTVRLESGGATLGVTGRHLRPRAVKRIDAAKVAVGDQVMANYNVEDPEQRGLWFDAVVTSKRRISTGKGSRLQATVFQGPALSPRKECCLRFTDELYVPDLPGTQRNARFKEHSSVGQSRTARRRTAPRRSKLFFGPPPDVRVGQRWSSRVQVSKTLVHRPTAAAIDGSAAEGACSLVLYGASLASDAGHEAVFVGRERRPGLCEKNGAASGANEPLLSGLNLALARSCATGGETNRAAAGDARQRWCEGRAVRVVRTARGAKGSEFAPPDGYRYDGIYKVVSYWPVPSERAWHFRLRRDDPSPAPWTAKDAETSGRRLARKRRRGSSGEVAALLPSKRLLRA